MSDLYGLELEPMPNRLVNYGTTDNGIAVIELASDSAGSPLEGDAMGPNTYTHGMMCDIVAQLVERVTKIFPDDYEKKKEYLLILCK